MPSDENDDPRLDAGNYDFQPVVERFFDNGFPYITVTLVKEVLFGIYMSSECNAGKTDFEVAQDLGLKPTQVRNLRYRYRQNQNHEDDVREPAIEDVLFRKSGAFYDAGSKMMRVQIDTAYDLEWTKNYIRNEAGEFAEISLSGDVLSVSPSYYMQLLSELCESRPELKLEPKLEETIKKFSAANHDFRDIAKMSKGERFRDWVRSPGRIEAILGLGSTGMDFFSKLPDIVSSIV